MIICHPVYISSRSQSRADLFASPLLRRFFDFSHSFATGTLPGGEVETEVETVQVDLSRRYIPCLLLLLPSPPPALLSLLDPRSAWRAATPMRRRTAPRSFWPFESRKRPGRPTLETTKRVGNPRGLFSTLKN